MEAIVLAGGFGTRLRELVPDVPKPMAPVAGRPFLDILLRSLSEKGFKHVILSVGYRAETIIAHFGNDFEGMELSYEIETSPLGTGGAVRTAMQHCRGDHVFVFNGDTFLDLEVGDVELRWQLRRTPMIVVRKVPDAARYGAIKVENGLVAGFVEKGVEGPGLINAGCYVFPTDLFEDRSLGERFSLESDFLPDSIKQRPYEIHQTDGVFIDIGIPEDYRLAQDLLAKVAQ